MAFSSWVIFAEYNIPDWSNLFHKTDRIVISCRTLKTMHHIVNLCAVYQRLYVKFQSMQQLISDENFRMDQIRSNAEEQADMRFLIWIQLPSNSRMSGMSNLADHLALKSTCSKKIAFHTHGTYLNAAKTMLICPWVSLSLSTLKLVSLIGQDPPVSHTCYAQTLSLMLLHHIKNKYEAMIIQYSRSWMTFNIFWKHPKPSHQVLNATWQTMTFHK